MRGPKVPYIEKITQVERLKRELETGIFNEHPTICDACWNEKRTLLDSIDAEPLAESPECAHYAPPYVDAPPAPHVRKTFKTIPFLEELEPYLDNPFKVLTEERKDTTI